MNRHAATPMPGSTATAETAWLAAMCTEAALLVVERAIDEAGSIHADGADRLRLVVRTALEPAVGEVIEKMASPDIALQPIVHVEGRTPIGYEALVRFGGGMGATDAFRRAAERNLHVEIEIVALRAALDRMVDLPAGTFLGVNVSADALTDARVIDVLATADTSRLVIELTQQADIDDVALLKRNFRQLQSDGAVICVDGAGVGFFTAARIIELEPEMIKIARTIVSGCDVDTEKQQRVRNFVELGRRLGAVAVAVGVEREPELAVLQRLGVDAVQGHLFGEPQTDGVPVIDAAQLAVAM